MCVRILLQDITDIFFTCNLLTILHFSLKASILFPSIPNFHSTAQIHSTLHAMLNAMLSLVKVSK